MQILKCLPPIILLVVFDSISGQDEITPRVWIYDERPATVSGRVISYQNSSVEIIGYVGENVVLQCNVFNMPTDSQIFWIRKYGDILEYINDGLMSRDMSRWFVGQGKQPESIRLEILSLDSSYEGLYSCECRYSGAVKPIKVERYLRVVQKPQIIQYDSTYSTDATAGDRVTLKCNATGIPTPTVSWRRTGGSSSIIRNYGAEKSGVSILFEQVQAEDAGEYVCFARNYVGESSWSVELRVRHKPVANIHPVDPSQKLNCNIMLLCDVSANPSVKYSQVSWSDEISQIEEDNRHTLKFLDAGRSKFLYLTIKNLQSSDFKRKFSCSATNFLGTIEKSVTLKESLQENKLLNGRMTCSAMGISNKKLILITMNICIYLILKYLFQ